MMNGQSLKVVEAESKVLGTIGSEIKSSIKIKNTSDKTIHIKIKRLDNNINSGQTSYFCVGEECYDETETILPGTIAIKAGMILDDFSGILKTGLSETQSSVTYCFYDVAIPSDAVCHEINYVIENRKLKGILFYNNDIRISEIYPNPIDNIAIFDYNLVHQNNKAKIIIHDVLGSMVGEYQLPAYENSLKIPTQEFTPGVYFYTLHINNSNLITKKMVIKR